MNKLDHELGEHDAAIESLQADRDAIFRRLDWLTALIIVSLADIPITLVM